MKNNETGKRLGLYVRLSPNEKLIIDKLKNEYSLNISQMIKNFLKKTFERLEGEKNK